jgi:glycosyltransferase involved in cell wall biosynthesis
MNSALPFQLQTGAPLSETLGQDGRLSVMQVVDTLDMGGAERVAVNLANGLPHRQFASYICSTRRGGPLQRLIASHVTYLALHRKSRFDLAALCRLALFISENRIEILHAHGSSLFLARAAAMLARCPVIVWHDHYGRCNLNDRSPWLYRLATRGMPVIAVNQLLAEWSRTRLAIPADRVSYVPNWVEGSFNAPLTTPLPGVRGRRIVCVANLRSQKDQLTLLRAMQEVRQHVPDVHLILVGSASEPAYAEFVNQQILDLRLVHNVTYLGPRTDVGSILEKADIGVLSSVSEGLPLALLEYGMASLPVVATDVGQCREVFDDGRVGILVPPSSPNRLAEALVFLLKSPRARAAMGEAFRQHVRSRFSAQSVMGHICAVYRGALLAKRGQAPGSPLASS